MFMKRNQTNFAIPDVCVKKIIHPPQLDNEQYMVISELNMLLLAKGEMYNIDGFT